MKRSAYCVFRIAMAGTFMMALMGAKMAGTKVTKGKWNARSAVTIENDRLKLVVLPGGGHIAALELKSGPAKGISPLWKVPWPSMEPSRFKDADLPKYGGPPEGRLLASIMGHNLCMDYFGGPSKAEQAQGYTVHGEAPVQMWDVAFKGGALECDVKLPMANLAFHRSIRLVPDSSVARFDCEIKNLSDQPRDVGWQEHVTFGPPFVEKGVAAFDCSATWGQVLPSEFSRHHRLKKAAEFTWPMVEGSDGKKVDLRVYPNDEFSGDFSTQLMDPQEEWAWLAAVNPKQRLLIGYLWKRVDFPWLGNWEENYSRQSPPWNGKTLTRGLEFGLSPFPSGREEMKKLGRLHGTPTLGRLTAKGNMKATFWAWLAEVPAATQGVANVDFDGKELMIKLRPTGNVTLKAK